LLADRLYQFVIIRGFYVCLFRWLTGIFFAHVIAKQTAAG